PRLQHGHLQDLDALLLAARETVVQIARGKLAGDLETIHLREELLPKFRNGHRVVLATGLGLPDRVDRAPQEARDRDAWNGVGILEGKEEPSLCPLVGSQFEDVL